MADDEQSVLLYHEVQESKLCAVHCLNAVLQGPYFSELELASIGRDLDQTEREMMLERGPQSAEYLRFMSEGSSNVALDGNFSIQVLQKALGMLDLKCIPLNAPELEEARKDPQRQNAYICNLHEHWFALRKVGNEWYNFNSLIAAPQHLSSFYMSAFLDSLKNEGWSIFLVQGELPRDYNSAGGIDSAGGFGHWFTPEQAEQALQAAAKREEKLEESDPMLEAAIAASLKDVSQPAELVVEEDDDGLDADESELAAAIAASLVDDSHMYIGSALAVGQQLPDGLEVPPTSGCG